MPKLHLITYGCQMNEYDSERVAGLLKREHYELTEVAEEADLVLLNTCAIREKAEDKVFSRLGQLGVLKRQRPDLLIGVMGCMAQLWQGKILDRAPHVDLVFGSAVVSRVGELVERARTTGATILETGEAPLVKITAKPDRPGQLKAFVTVMEGCEKFCTFCVVPMTRGRERSHSPDAVVAEVRELAASGVREVTLLGQTVNAYGRDLTPATDLAALLERIDELTETVPGIALSTDLIVGFPGETHEDFELTVEVVERVRYDNVFAFRYSRRPGTPAADMGEQVPDEVKARRNARILEVAGRVGAERSRALEGRILPLVVPVLVTRALPHSLRGELAGAGAAARVLAATV